MSGLSVTGFLFKGWYTKKMNHVRPLWEIVLMFFLMLVYWPARKYVDWMDGL